MTTAPPAPPAEADEQQLRPSVSWFEPLEVDEDSFELGADGSPLSDVDKAQDSRQEAAENEQQAREAVSLKERHFWRNQGHQRRAEALGYERRRRAPRRNQSINTSASSRRSGHRRAPSARPVHQSGSRRTSSRSTGGGSSGDSDSDGPAGGRRTDLSAQARARLELRAPSAWMQERAERYQRARRGRPEQLRLGEMAS
jgi:hypothetical protein